MAEPESLEKNPSHIPAMSKSAHESAAEPPSPTWWWYFKLTRLHKFPAGSILLFWPCAWGIAMSAYRVNLPLGQVITQTVLYLLGSTLRHNAGCIWNDICDRDFDRQVARCKTRPLACGAVSVTGAVVLFIAHLIACSILVKLSGSAGFKIGLVGLFFIDTLYPFMKRWTNWPQAWLGLAITWGLPVSWISIRGPADLDAMFVLFVGGVCWTIFYDTIYGCQDRRDDVKAGVKSTAVLFGNNVRPILAIFAALFVGCIAYAGVRNGASYSYFALSVGGTALHLAWQLRTLDFDNSAECWDMFTLNGNQLGMIIWGGMLGDYVNKVVFS